MIFLSMQVFDYESCEFKTVYFSGKFHLPMYILMLLYFSTICDSDFDFFPELVLQRCNYVV